MWCAISIFRATAALLLCLSIGLSWVQEAVALDSAHMRLRVDAKVVHCEVGPVGDLDALQEMLQQGASVTVRWVFTISRVRDYWLDEDTGEVTVTRVVSSDLISRRWMLRDKTSGVVSETSDTNRSVRFLSYLEDFPLIDRALLHPGATYEVRVRLHVRDSDQPMRWWQKWVDFGKTVALQRFTLPAEEK